MVQLIMAVADVQPIQFFFCVLYMRHNLIDQTHNLFTCLVFHFFDCFSPSQYTLLECIHTCS